MFGSRSFYPLRLRRSIIVSVVLLIGSIVSADTSSTGIGYYAVVPEFNLGLSVAVYDLVSILGFDGSVFGWSDEQEDVSTRYRVGGALGINVQVIPDLYTGIGAIVQGASTKRTVLRSRQDTCHVYHGEPHCEYVLRTELDRDDPRWGVEAKLIYRWVDGYMGFTVGYRMIFEDPLVHQVMFGTSLVIPNYLE